MATFPALRTGAVAQYPFSRTQSFQTEMVRFLDGSRQQYRINPGPLRKWRVRLELLDQQELASVIAFVEAQSGDVFAFSDPVSGDTVARCVLSEESFRATLTDESNGDATVVIEEIP
jgi:hypothetical protein